MRVMVKFTLPTQESNDLVSDGSIGQTMQTIIGTLQPEAAYFCHVDGKRGGYLIVDLKNTSEIPKYAEPWFLYFDATVKFLPAMTPEDLQKAGLEKLGKKWA